MSQFVKCNLHELCLQKMQAHGGRGLILFHRIASREDLAGACNFIDLAELPAGATIGRHRHASDEEEFYLVLSGEGTMWRDGEEFAVRPGDVIRNTPGGTHGLQNTGPSPLRIFVFEVRAP